MTGAFSIATGGFSNVSLMKKTTINFIIDGLMFICMAAITGIGFLIKYTLVSGQERRIKYDENVELYLFGLNRHEWGSIHLIIGFILLGLLVLHIILHWKFITCVYNRMFKKGVVKRLSTILFITICSLFIITPFLVKPEVALTELGRRREITIEVKGYMTLGEISKKYKVPTNIIKTRLNIPISTPDNQKLSWVRNKYNIKIHDIEELIKEYKTEINK